ncbi:uncharacterized protein YkwD [Rhizobium alvei]|uniref:CAP domain-containing protein n=2 Tax=Rhizobium alvei TaxID=1132659 RepID=A0ABT8YMS6_9HYPH|nr:CAP domain-containing protein [Rhizobium alvei]MDO6964599.1 CAP domain-containing protein [Rhizobium alvei]
MTVLSLSDRRGALRFLVGCTVMLAVSGCTSTTVLSPPAPAGPVADFTAQALPIVNQVRAKKGLPPLAVDPVAVAAARDQAMRMASQGKMAHQLSRESFGQRMIRMGVPLPASENIAAGQKSVEAAVAAWISSPKHYENMVGNYQGLGVVRAENGADGRPFWAMVLSSKPHPPRGRAPFGIVFY